MRVPVGAMGEAVMQAIEEHVFTPEAVDQIIESAEGEDLDAQRRKLE